MDDMTKVFDIQELLYKLFIIYLMF